MNPTINYTLHSRWPSESGNPGFMPVRPYDLMMIFPTHGTTVSPSTGVRPATVMGTKTRLNPPRPRDGGANGGTHSAEYLTVEGCGIPVEASSAFGWEGPVDRAVPVGMHVLGHNLTATVDGSRESVLAPRRNTQPQTPLRGILVARLRLAGNQNATRSGDALQAGRMSIADRSYSSVCN